MIYDQNLIQLINNDPQFNQITYWAKSYKVRINEVLPEEYWSILSNIKKQAVDKKNENLAKVSWCFESIGAAQDKFITAILQAKEEEYYNCWCTLEECEYIINALENHIPINTEYGLTHIKIHTKRFQDLFPYRFFLSPGMVVKTVICSICREPFKLRGGCDHIVGEIYGGNMCHRILTEVEPLEISVVENPVQKYSVVFGPEVVYDYGAIRYVVHGLQSPWHPWKFRAIETKQEIFPGIRRNETCPCGSSKKYKKCCLQIPKTHTHYDIVFKYPPPSSLPNYLADGSYKVKGSLKELEKINMKIENY